ncbi:MAG: alpha/beta hydrolase [Deltaproteobacteria bacterium]|nr:MAG: alpha/beta hydrolase [Deltaproteobacteria bacterium]
MDEKETRFSSNNLELEGLLNLLPGEKGVVVTHPHPLYGGDMKNAVVESLIRVFLQEGFTTLRFNFRGVGGSQGEYDQGQGEQTDVRSALKYMTQREKREISLVGYSFGAWVNVLAGTAQEEVQKMLMISPPVAFLDFSSVTSIPQLELVIAGDRDQIAPPNLIETMLPVWNPAARLEVIEGADHFYGGYIGRLESIITAHLKSEPV